MSTAFDSIRCSAIGCHAPANADGFCGGHTQGPDGSWPMDDEPIQRQRRCVNYRREDCAGELEICTDGLARCDVHADHFESQKP